MKKSNQLILLGTYYEATKNEIILKLYNLDNDRIEYLPDWTNYEPYLLTSHTKEEIKNRLNNLDYVTKIENIDKIDPFSFKLRSFRKISVQTPADIPRIRRFLQGKWEYKIPYHHNWIYDNRFTPGMIYQRINGKLVKKTHLNQQKTPDFNEQKFQKKYGDLYSDYINKFIATLPELLLTSFDIEIYTEKERIPKPEDPIDPINCISVVSTNGDNHIFLLVSQDEEQQISHPKIPNGIIRTFNDEKQLLRAFFTTITKYPIIVTFNGNSFDYPYLQKRAHRLQLKTPIEKENRVQRYNFKDSIHLDMYEWYKNPAIKTYAFSYVYKTNDLDTIAKALINQGKIQHEKSINQLSNADLAYYCWNDSKITLKITTFDNQLPFKLITYLSRITYTSIEEITSNYVFSWLKNLFYAEHRRKNYLIPNRKDISIHKTTENISESVTKNKKYKGAIVIDPIPGIHFDVKVLDFASLYPSIIASRNLSYETINCDHDKCKTEIIKGTSYYTCKKNKGLLSQLIGLLRDIRVYWLKPVSKEKTLNQEDLAYFSALEKSVKVLINASYGVLGNEHFPFYCLIVADATTAVGRFAIKSTVDKCQDLGIEVLYGDTDSVFLNSPTKKQVQQLINWSKNVLEIELEIDKEYLFCAFSTRKKNYLGLLKNERIDIKGLLGIKRNTPLFIQNVFQDVLDVLKTIKKPEDVDETKEKVKNIVNKCYRDLENNNYSYEQLAIRVQLTRSIDDYKSNPIHVKAAKMLRDSNIEVKKGQIIKYVKIKNKVGIKPLQLLRDEPVDIKAYKSYIDSTFSQILEAFGIDINKLKQKINLMTFFSKK